MSTINTSQQAMSGTEAFPEDEAMPLVGVVVDEAEGDDDSPDMEIEDNGDLIDGLVPMFKERFSLARNARQTCGIQEEWMRGLLDDRGEYDDETKKKLRPDRSQVFVRLAAAQSAAARSMILQLYLSEKGYPWDIEPTSVPEIQGVNVKLMEDAMEMAAGMITDPAAKEEFKAKNNFSELIEQVQSKAASACDQMRQEMSDQLEEMHWEERFTRAIDPYTIYGTMVVQGPLSMPKKPRKWLKGKKGDWKLALSRTAFGQDEKADDAGELRPEFKILDIWQCYPDPSATCKEQLSEMHVRHVMTRHALKELANDKNFMVEKIKELLEAFPTKGNWTAEANWEHRVEGATADASSPNKYDRFTVIESWLYINGRTLEKYGIEVGENLLDADCLVQFWWCEDKCIRASVSNLEPPEMPFYFVPYEAVPSRIWGRGVPAQMRDSQDIYNACERAKLDNMAATAIPQILVDLARLSARTKADTFFAGKVWFFSDLSGSNQPPLQLLNVNANFQHMDAIQQAVRWHIQKETNIPDFAMGLPTSTGHNRTAEGLAMQQSAAMAFIRGVIANIDATLTTPMLEAMYNWNMNFGSRDDIKGDYRIVAKGVAGAINQQVLSQKLAAIANQIGAELKYWINPDKLMQKMLHIDGVDKAGITNDAKTAMALKQQDANMAAEAKASSDRMQPVTPVQNALLEMLQALDERSPLFGPTFQKVAEIYGVKDGRMQIGIDAIDALAADAVRAALSPEAAAALGAPVAGQPASLNPATGAEVSAVELAPQPAAPQQPMPMPQSMGIPMNGAV